MVYLIIGILFNSCSVSFLTDENLSHAIEPGILEAISSSRDLFNDMFLSHQNVPHCVPNQYGWKHGPVKTYGIKPPEGWDAVVSWGQVYAVEREPNPDINFPLARVHLKDLRLYSYHKDGTWKLMLNDQNPIGEMYAEDYEDYPDKPYYKKAEIMEEAEGGISIQAGSGYNFHFYSDKKQTVDIDNLTGFFVVCKARLIGYESYKTMPKYIVNVGGDWYKSKSASHDPDLTNNGDIAIGRFKLVTPEWQYIIMHTFSKYQIRKYIFPNKVRKDTR